MFHISGHTPPKPELPKLKWDNPESLSHQGGQGVEEVQERVTIGKLCTRDRGLAEIVDTAVCTAIRPGSVSINAHDRNDQAAEVGLFPAPNSIVRQGYFGHFGLAITLFCPQGSTELG